VGEIFQQAIGKLTSQNTSLLHVLLYLLLLTTSRLKDASDSEVKLCPKVSKLLMDEWIVRHHTPVFGGTHKLRDSDKDIKVYNTPNKLFCGIGSWSMNYILQKFVSCGKFCCLYTFFMHLTLEGFIGMKCPANMESEWYGILEDTLTQRVERVVRSLFIILLSNKIICLYAGAET
jgi:hypothetical protein